MNNRQLVEELIKIKEKIRALIPLAANRYESIEGCPRVEDANSRKVIYQERFLARFPQLEARHSLIRKRAVYEYYNEIFDQFIKDQALSLPVTLTAQQAQDLQHSLAQSQHKFQVYVERLAKYIPQEKEAKYQEALANCENEKDFIIQQLCSGKRLQLEDVEMEARFHLINQCVENRAIAQQQLLFVISDVREISKHEQLTNLLRKRIYYNKAMILDRLQVSSGYCDENAILGLLYIHNRLKNTIESFSSLEKIRIKYHQGDGHTFLVLNRDPGSQLNDMSKWGNEAIIFDPWNDLVHEASKLHELPIFYLSYPEDAMWEVDLVYNHDDSTICRELNNLEENLAITGHLQPEKRHAGICEEYELTPVNSQQFPVIHHLLTTMLAKARPRNFNCAIQFMLTLSGDLPVQLIQGFNAVTIALHVDIFKQQALTIGELQFAVKRVLYLAKHYPTCTEEMLPGALMQSINHEVISDDENALDAMSYLTKCQQFSSQHSKIGKCEFNLHSAANILGSYKKNGNDYAIQVKAIETMLAVDSGLNKSNISTSITMDMLAEAAQCQKKYFFQHDFERCTDGGEQLRYLISVMPELHQELWPFENVSYPSIRVREYVVCLQRAVSALTPEEINLLDEWVNTAMRLRIPGFQYLYYKMQQVEPKYDKQNLRAYGRFREYDEVIQSFKCARTFAEALHFAQAIHQFDKEFADHYCLLHITDKSSLHNHHFHQQHRRLPVGHERFFGSMVAAHIKWSGFDATDAKKPWQSLTAFAKQDSSRQILFALWRLNVVVDPEVWEQFRQDEMKYLISPKKDMLKKIPAFALFYLMPINYMHINNEITYELRARYLTYRRRQPVDSSLWAAGHGFEESFTKFFDKHEALLDFDNNVASYRCLAQSELLRQFALAAARGDSYAIPVIKSFFFGREDQRDLFKIMANSACPKDTILSDADNYVIFMMAQQFDDIKFDIFTMDEILTFMQKKKYLNMVLMSRESLLSLFRLTADTITVGHLPKIYEILAKFGLYNCRQELILACIKRFKLMFLSEQAILLVKLLKQYHLVSGMSVIDKYVNESFVWPTLSELYQYEFVDLEFLIYSYRLYDGKFIFPSDDHQRALSDLIDLKLMKINDTEKRIHYYEMILISKELLPITDISWINRIICGYVQALLQKYGIDNGSMEYFQRLKPIIDQYTVKQSMRDFVAIMKQLTVAIEAQQILCDYIGMIACNDDYQIKKTHDDKPLTQLMILSHVISVFNKTERRRLPFIDFLSTSLSKQSLAEIDRVVHNDSEVLDLYKMFPQYEYSSNQPTSMQPIFRLVYQLFWDQAIKERAVIVNYLLIPPNYTQRAHHEELAYQEAFRYMAHKLFPDAVYPNSDEHLALAILTSYLATADIYQRGYLLTALLVATNEVNTCDGKTSVGARFALLCEHMGPAFVKLAQAIHSHPLTPTAIKADLAHVKGRANIPTRWDLWRLIVAVVPKEVMSRVMRVGQLLGSASYNLAVQVETTNGIQVLSLLREHAERDAVAGFTHLVKTLHHCQHPRLQPMRQTLLSIVQQSAEMSRCEMDLVVSRQQFAVAQDIYNCDLVVDGEFQVSMRAAQLFESGSGYRLMQKMTGMTFNSLPFSKVQQIVARVVIFMEYRLMLHGRYFDSDRHGEQYRIHFTSDFEHIHIGLFDFGEMTILQPSDTDIKQFAAILSQLPKELHRHTSLATALQYLMADATNPYLMRIRKGLLALQDFHEHLDDGDLLDILQNVLTRNDIHPLLQAGLQACISQIEVAAKLQAVKRWVTSGFGLFANPSRHIEFKQIVMPSLTKHRE